jgi:hypothetical protein
MEWIAVFTFGAVALIGLLAARGAASDPALGVQAIAGVAGLALCIVFLAVGGSKGVAWGAFAAAVVGLVAGGIGTAWLISDQHTAGTAAQQSHEETEASLEGLELPLLGLAATFALLTALGVATLH